MERLQAAIEKARVQREEAIAAGRDPGPESATPAPAAPALSSPERDGLWQALRPIDTERMRMATRQIVTQRPGNASAPFDVLRTRIVQQAKANKWRRIAITSPHSGCGKSVAIANLAFSLGRQAEVRSLILDFDLRRSTLASLLGQTVTTTMGDVLEGRISFSEHGLRHSTNLAFGLNARPVPHSAELLQSTATIETLAAIEAAYAPDLVLFEVPPLRAADDSIGFLRQVDAAVIIVAAEETPMKQIDVAERQVAELTNVMGIVLNKCRIMDGEYGYDDYSV